MAAATMDPVEVSRRESDAIRDLAATALYHANRLPPESRWRHLFLRIRGVLPPTAPSPAKLIGGQG